MKTRNIATLAAALTLVITCAIQAAKAPKAPRDGIRGTISSVGANSFVITLLKKPADGDGTLTVICDVNTKFIQGKTAVDASAIKEGVNVGVVRNNISPTELHASVVTIESSPGKPTTKKAK